MLQSIGSAGAAIAAGGALLSEAETARAGYCYQYENTKVNTTTYWGDKDGTSEMVEKEFVHASTVRVDGPYEMDHSSRIKYYIPVHNMCVAYVKDTGEPQIDIPSMYTSVEYPDEGSASGAEWDFPQENSEPKWISRFDEQQNDYYDLEDFAQDAAFKSFQYGVDIFEDTVATPYRVVADSVGYYNDMHQLYDKYQQASSDTRTMNYDWSFTNDDARERIHTMMMFEVSDIDNNVGLPHTIESYCLNEQIGSTETITHNLNIEGEECCNCSPYQ